MLILYKSIIAFFTAHSHQIALALVVIVSVLSLSSCVASVDNSIKHRQIEIPISNNNFHEGIRQLTLLQDDVNPLYDEKNAISLFLDKGFLEHYAGEYRESAQSLLFAERSIQEAFTKSISENVLSYILNDNTKEYPGEDFEDIYLSVFNAINFFKQGSIDGALVEVRKLTLPSGKLDMLGRKYDVNNEKLIKHGENEMNMVETDEEASKPEKKAVTFTNSALARYLSVLFYQADGNHDAVRIELNQLKNAYSTQPGIYTSVLPNAVAYLSSPTNDKERLDILCFTGLSPIKVERIITLYFPFFNESINRYHTLRVPALVTRANRIDRVEVEADGMKYELELLEDMGAVIIDTFNARYSNIFLKTYIRTLIKLSLADIAATETRKRTRNMGTGGSLLNLASAIGSRLLVEASEGADIRMSRYLPNKVYVGNITLAQGTYDVTINYYAGNRLVNSESHRDVEIKRNTVNLLNTVNLDININYLGG